MTLTSGLFDRWLKTWVRTGIPAPEDLFDNLVLRYADPNRAYHSILHLQECLEALDEFREPSLEAELAAWFHDAVYDVQSADNEEQSAALALRSLAVAGVPEAECRRVRDLILLTKHGSEEPVTEDGRRLLDADLSILGSPWERFSEYGRQIRLEYAHVPDGVFRSARSAILRRILDRPTVFRTSLFRARLEGRARLNLERALAELRS